MLFPTTDFAIFFGIVFILNWLLAPFPRRWKVFIIAASYVFYAWWDWRFIFLLAISTVTTIAGGRLVHRSVSERARRFWLVATLTAELGLLAWFKYYGFVYQNVDSALHRLGLASLSAPMTVTLPVGISFFTFMGLSYVFDIYRRRLEPSPWLDVAVFVCFFPHLVAGPIVRGSDLLPQITSSSRRNPRHIDLPRAAYLIFGGLFKKVVLSSYISSAIVDTVFANPGLHSAPEVLFAVWGYAVQIYCDFSGYTDIAIGCALLLGFRFPENFNSPYTARSLQDFWRRWHMTLSFWLRDYVYIPLGGNQGSSKWTMYRNIMITMLLGGLWHGAGWTFVAWGALHGAGQCTGHWRRGRRVARGLPAQSDGRLAVAWQRFATFQYVCLGWVFFRATSFSNAFAVLGRLTSGWALPSPLVTFPVLLTILVGIGTQYVPQGVSARAQDVFGRLRPALQGITLAGILLVITTMGPPGVAPFIYFRF
ncbi:MAG: MBOAT family O-acyltransferase [Acidimicrobiales bacterium]|jgi:D-alanyl-lipoteichoic acid acyltransferase DltB (MBOAT superfamily)